jgi:hypothetical protein
VEYLGQEAKPKMQNPLEPPESKLPCNLAYEGSNAIDSVIKSEDGNAYDAARFRSALLADEGRRNKLGLSFNKETNSHNLYSYADPNGVLNILCQLNLLWKPLTIRTNYRCDCGHELQPESELSFEFPYKFHESSPELNDVDTALASFSDETRQDDMAYDCERCENKVNLTSRVTVQTGDDSTAMYITLNAKHPKTLKPLLQVEYNEKTFHLVAIVYFEKENHYAVAIRNSPDGTSTYHNSSPTHVFGSVTKLSFQQLQDFQVNNISGLLYSEFTMTDELSPLRSVKFDKNNCYCIAALMIAAAYTRLTKIHRTPVD